MGPETSDQFRRAERLDDVIIRAEAEAADLIDLFFPGGDKKNRRVRPFAHFAAEGEAVVARKHDVQKDGVDLDFLHDLQCFFTVFRDAHEIIIRFEEISFQFRDESIVFDNEYVQHDIPPVMGNVMVMASPSRFSAAAVPPCAAAIWETTYRPRPEPAFF